MAIMILLVNPHLFTPAIQSHALLVCMVAGLFALMVAYAAGSTQNLRTSVFTIALLVLFMSILGLLFLVKAMRKIRLVKEMPGRDATGRTDVQRLATQAREEV